MRQQRTQRMSASAPISKVGTGLPTDGYALIVDGQANREFDTQDRAIEAASELKERFPMLQVKVYDAETKQSEMIERAA